ncbi:TPA: hypothetical protein ACH3X3_002076 [Trebouxia sp. C0006]
MTAASRSLVSVFAARRVCLLRLQAHRSHLRSYSFLRTDHKVRNPLWHRVCSVSARQTTQYRSEVAEMNRNNGSAYLQVLGLGLDTADAVPSVLLFFDHQRYIFNAGEGFQRFCVQHKLKLNRMPNILVTRASLDAVGGIPGMVLTVADSSISHQNHDGLGSVGNFHADIYGPKGIEHLGKAMSFYMRMKGVNLHELQPAAPSEPDAVNESTQLIPEAAVSSAIIQNEAVSITPVILQPGSEGAESQPNKRQKTDDGSLPTGQEQDKAPLAACYICCLTSTPGKFLPQKAKELGVKPGPLFGQLKAGTAVMGKDRMVQPEEVLEAAPAAPVVIIADCPSPAHLPALLSSSAWEPFLHHASSSEAAASKSSTHQKVNCIVHLAPQQVVQMPQYQQWMAGFGTSTKQVVLNCEAVPSAVTLPSPATLQIKLNCIDPKAFPLPQTLGPDSSTAVPTEVQLQQSDSISKLQGSNLLRYNLRPASRVDTVETAEQSLSIPTIQGQLRTEMPEVMEAVERGQAEACSPSEEIPDVITQAGAEELEVVFLGTGAAMPSKYRNVTSIYINRFLRGGMLLDCGEGTLGQLTRRFGRAKVKDIVCSLACVWVSHIHADHHAGLPRILAARAEWLGPDCSALPVFGPWCLERILHTTAAMQPMPHLFFNQAGLLAEPQHEPSQEMQAAVSQVKAQLGLKTLQSLLVVHCAHAYAAILEGESGWKVVFSGDTRPCEQMVHAAKDATLLIHEATFEDELVEDALAKRHSLTYEAVQIGAQSGAYRTILTHFSQRYPKIPKIEKSFLTTTCIAFDLMSINLKDLPQLPSHVPAATLLCKDVSEEGDNIPEA